MTILHTLGDRHKLLRVRNEVVKQKFLEADPLDETEPLSDILTILKEEPAKRSLHIVI